MTSLRIVFMGTPEFAVPSLEQLNANGFTIVAVVTAPDKPQGRGRQLTPSPVKEWAVKNGLPVLQPSNLKSESFLNELKSFNANLQVVVAFRMLPDVVWAMPLLGTLNLHASLLPNYRGAAPINWAIINGEKETGVTTFFLRHEIDTGNIIFQEREPIHDNDTAGSLYERLMIKGAQLVVKTVGAIASGYFPALPQTEIAATRPAPKIFKETCEINWNQPAEQIHNFVRGLSPYPAAWSLLNGTSFKIFAVTPVKDENDAQPGEIRSDNKTYLHVKIFGSWVAVTDLQPDGKRRMSVQEFLRGNKI